MKLLSKFTPVPKELFFSRNDSLDPRLGDQTKGPLQEGPRPEIFLLGYPDDEGIEQNGGRVGAHLAPNRIRKYLYKMTPPLDAIDETMRKVKDKNTASSGPLTSKNKIKIVDLGNLSAESEPLRVRHEKARQTIKTILDQKSKGIKHPCWISFGGGHDYGFSDAAGFLDKFATSNPKKKPLILNFDAHLDVRPPNVISKSQIKSSPQKKETEIYHSGTPFYRILAEQRYAKRFHFFEIGIQNQCNSQAHANWCQAHGGHILSYQHIRRHQNLLAAMKSWRVLTELLDPRFSFQRECFISWDIDVFSNSLAPGCSQAWSTGLRTDESLEALGFLQSQTKARGLGIYEVSPPLDFDDHTSKLAALLAHSFMFSSSLPARYGP